MKIISSMWRPGNPDCQLIMTNVSEIAPAILAVFDMAKLFYNFDQ